MNRNSLTYFEDLSNEIIYEIFEYLDIHHVYEGFTNLNQRFHHLLTYSTLPIKISIPLISKSKFLQYCQQIIEPNKQRIISLHSSNIFITDFLFLSANHFEEFLRLETLILNKIKSTYMNDFLKGLSNLSNLHSLIFSPSEPIENKDKLYHAIFRLPVLKYCKLTFTASSRCSSLSFARNESSPIEHLIIDGYSRVDEIAPILSYVPQLRRLSWSKLTGLDCKLVEAQGITLKYLTHVSLQLQYMTFNQFEPLIINIFHQLEVLRLSTGFDRTFFDQNRWEQLISTYMPYLRIFDVKHMDNNFSADNFDQPCLASNNLFTSSFWLEHQWYFTHQCVSNGNMPKIVFYSTNPYRRKCYTLYGESDKECCFRNEEINLDIVRHVNIQSVKAMRNCKNYFSNVTELTLSNSFDESIEQTTDYLKTMFPLMKLSKLYIDCAGFCFSKVLYLLKFLPNIHTLSVYSISLFDTECITIENNELFQFVSNTNIIKNFTVQNECRLEQMEFLIELCPRLQYISVDIYRKDFKSILQLLLSKTNSSLPDLFSLCIVNAHKKTEQNLIDLIASNQWCDNYSIVLTDRTLYLWW